MSKTNSNSVQPETRIEDIKDKVRIIAEEYNPEKIILFGSFSSGTPTPHSDVDLLVIVDTDRSTWELGAEISLLFKHSYPMDIIVRTPKEITRRLNAGDYFIRDLVENGKVLYEQAG